MNELEILTRREAAELLKVPIQTVDYFVRTGQIPFSRLGMRTVRFRKDRLLQWLKERENVEFRMPRRGGSAEED